MLIWAQDCLSRIFPHTSPSEPTTGIFLSAAKGEVACFQVGVRSEEGLREVRAEAGELRSEGSHLPEGEVLYQEYVPVHWHTSGNPPDDLEGAAPGFYPDPLPPEPSLRGCGASLPKVRPLWVRYRTPRDAEPREYEGEVRVAADGDEARIKVHLRVHPFALPEEPHLLMTNWLSLTSLCRFHRVEPLSEPFWDVLGRYARDLSDHRQTVILTPLFAVGDAQLVEVSEPEPGRYTFDFRDLDRWAELFFGYGFKLLEGSHLAGGSKNPSPIVIDGQIRHFPSTEDPAWRSFISQYLRALRDHLRERGWLDRFLLHISDEPHGDQLPLYASISELVRRVAPEFKLIDAMAEPEYAIYVDHPVPLEDRYRKFVESGLPRERVWFYYCCGPTGPWPNRFLDYPLVRVRIFTWVAFRYGIPGFLHWGLNHWDWHPPYYRRETYNPYDNTTCGVLAPGDGYLIYPPWDPERSKDPVDSVRWEVVRKAMEDYEYLWLLREIGGEDARTLLRELECDIVPDIPGHTRDWSKLEDFKERVASVITRKSVASKGI